MQTLELRWARRRLGRTNLPTEYLVRSRGLEPPRLAALAPQASASASSATTASPSIVKASANGVKRGKKGRAEARRCKTRKSGWQRLDRVGINSDAATKAGYGFLGGACAGCEVAGACCVVGCELAGVCDAGCEAAGGAPGVVAGVVAGVIGGVTGAGFGAGCETFCRIELPCPTALSLRSTNAMAQSMNMMAHHVVAFERTFAAPRGPKAVWLPAPPKAPARSAALPLWSRTTMIK